MTDYISRQAAIALADSLKDELPDDERAAYCVMAHNEGILEYQTALSLLPSAQAEIIMCKDCIWFDRYTDGIKKYQWDGFCAGWARTTYENWYCSMGKRRDNGRFNKQTGGD